MVTGLLEGLAPNLALVGVSTSNISKQKRLIIS